MSLWAPGFWEVGFWAPGFWVGLGQAPVVPVLVGKFLPPIFQALKASSAVKAIVGTKPPRIYRHGSAPQGLTQPYITWQLVSGTPENNLSDPPPFDRQTVQVDCWYPKQPNGDNGVELLAIAARDAIEIYVHMTSTILDVHEADTGLYRISMQFDWLLGRPTS